MRNLKRFNEVLVFGDENLKLPSKEDTTILDDIEHIFATLIEDYNPEIAEYATGVTTLTFKKLDCVVCSTIEEYHLAIQKQAHLVDSIIECIDKLKIHVPDLAIRIDNGTNRFNRESKNSIRIFLGNSECADIISRMI